MRNVTNESPKQTNADKLSGIMAQQTLSQIRGIWRRMNFGRPANVFKD